jgi:hypothetical protein
MFLILIKVGMMSKDLNMKARHSMFWLVCSGSVLGETGAKFNSEVAGVLIQS